MTDDKDKYMERAGDILYLWQEREAGNDGELPQECWNLDTLKMLIANALKESERSKPQVSEDIDPNTHEHTHSLYVRCLNCKTFGIDSPTPFITAAICGNCGSSETVKYYPSCCMLVAHEQGKQKLMGNEQDKPEYYWGSGGTKYTAQDPEVSCPHCNKTFRTDPFDATCRLCGKFFRDKVLGNEQGGGDDKKKRST